MIDLIQAMNRGIDLRPAQAWPLYGGGLLDRSKYITASEIGYCARKVKLDKETTQHLEPGHTKTMAKDDWGFWERGHNVEAWAVELITAGWDNDDYDLMYTGRNQVSFAEGVQSGTPDGVFVGDKTLGIAEFKSFDPRTNVSKLPKLTHVDQVMQNLDLASTLMGKSPVGGVILYIDASDHKRRHQFVIEWDQDHALRLEDRAHMIMDTDAKDLKPEGLFKDDCKYCAHTARCSQMIREERNGESYDHDLKIAGANLFG